MRELAFSNYLSFQEELQDIFEYTVFITVVKRKESGKQRGN